MAEQNRQSRNWKNFSIRMYADEYQALMALCDALTTSEMKVDPSMLLMTAAVEEATLLGFTPALSGLGGGTLVRPRPGTWPYAPDEREEESYTERITITCHPLQMHAVRRAAEWAGIKPGRFIIGSMWRFAAKRQGADPDNARLSAVAVPERYRL